MESEATKSDEEALTGPDDVPEIDDIDESGEERLPRRISEKQIKIFAVVAVVAVIVVVLLWGMVPDRIYEVRDVVDDVDGLEGENINIKGIITDWDLDDVNFTLADSNNENLTISVYHPGPFPEGFGINATAVVKGVITKEGQTFRFESTEIQIGCPSKY
jgi:cytochrome c-type biogenesis protein CcmE